MKVLVDGGAGSLGSSLTKMCLDMGFSVRVLDVVQKDKAFNLKEIMDQIDYRWKSVEDISKEDVEDVQVFIHCCAQADRPLGLSSPLYTIHKNTMELACVLEACRKANLQKFIYPSSGTIFTGVPSYLQPVTERTTPVPMNPYSATKYMDGVLCGSYHRCFGVPIVILRSGLVYGDGMRLDISIAQFIMKALRGEKIYVRSPKATRTPTHVEDVLLYWKKILELDA